jgi:hypothetical protein
MMPTYSVWALNVTHHVPMRSTAPVAMCGEFWGWRKSTSPVHTWEYSTFTMRQTDDALRLLCRCCLPDVFAHQVVDVPDLVVH